MRLKQILLIVVRNQKLKQILLLALIVSWLRQTDRQTDRHCHLLSCPGQLKRYSGIAGADKYHLLPLGYLKQNLIGLLEKAL